MLALLALLSALVPQSQAIFCIRGCDMAVDPHEHGVFESELLIFDFEGAHIPASDQPMEFRVHFDRHLVNRDGSNTIPQACIDRRGSHSLMRIFTQHGVTMPGRVQVSGNLIARAMVGFPSLTLEQEAQCRRVYTLTISFMPPGDYSDIYWNNVELNNLHDAGVTEFEGFYMSESSSARHIHMRAYWN